MDGGLVLQGCLLTITTDIEMEGVLCIFSQLIANTFFNNLDDAIESMIIKSLDDVQ